MEVQLQTLFIKRKLFNNTLMKEGKPEDMENNDNDYRVKSK